jgi:ATP-dependent protease ClpP protease subunit
MKRLFVAIALAFAFMGCVSNQASEAAQAKPKLIYLSHQNTIIFGSDVSDISVDTFIFALLGKRMQIPQNETMYIVISSPGGIYEEGLVLKDMMAILPNTQFVCVYCASASAMIFVAQPQPNRLITENSLIILHEAFRNHVTYKQVEKMDVQQFKTSSDEFNKNFWPLMKMSKEAYEKKIENSQWNIKGKESLKLNLADQLVKVECDGFLQNILGSFCSNSED